MKCCVNASGKCNGMLAIAMQANRFRVNWNLPAIHGRYSLGLDHLQKLTNGCFFIFN